MRFTNVLWRNKQGFFFRKQWEVQSNRKILDDGIPKALIEKGVQVHDALEIAGINPPKVVKQLASEPRPVDPLWKDRMCYVFHDRTRLLKGQEQAQLLTKTVVREGLPVQINNLVKKPQDTHDGIMKRQILQSVVWDGWQRLLPKRVDVKRPGQTFRREYGITKHRTIDLLLRNLVRHLDNRVASLTDAVNRNIFRHCMARVFVEKDGDLIEFNGRAQIVVTGHQPLAPFSDSSEVNKLFENSLPDIFPVKYTIDLDKTNAYDQNDFFPVTFNGSQPFVHTIYIYNPYPFPMWLPQHVTAKAMVTSYAFAVAQARRIYKDDVEQLQTPVTIQCVITDGREFLQLAYQLNTLNSNGRDGMKNIAWIGPRVKLYEEVQEVDGQMLINGYNPEIVEQLSAMHLNGLT